MAHTQPNPAVMEKLEKVLEKFHAKPISDITQEYTYFPNAVASKLGSGSYGEAFRMKSTRNPHNAAVVVKAIPKARITRTMLQVQHLAAELAVTGFVQHSHINHREDLFHSSTHIYIVLELCEGEKPDALTRVFLLFAKYNPARLPEAEGIVAEWEKEANGNFGQSAPEGASAEDIKQRLVDIEAFYDKKVVEFMTRQLGVRKEMPIAHDLFNCIVYNKRLPERKAKIILRQILLGLEHLHNNNIVHRDMKTENVVIGESRKVTPVRDADGNVTAVRIEERIDTKLIDFGLVKYMNLSTFPVSPSPSNFGGGNAFGGAAASDAFGGGGGGFGSGGAATGASGFGGGDAFGAQNKAQGFGQQDQAPVVVTPCGTEVYCALEVIQGILSSGLGRTKWQSTRNQLPKLDVYGAGTIMFCMCNGRPPFRVNNTYRQTNREEKVRQIQQLIAAGPVFSAACPESAQRLTKFLMHNDQAIRPTAADALKDEYFEKVTNTYIYEVSLTGEVTEIVDVDPSTGVGSRQSSAIVSNSGPEGSSDATGGDANNTTAEGDSSHSEQPSGAQGDGEDADLNDDIMAALRGKEDGGDITDKRSADTQ